MNKNIITFGIATIIFTIIFNCILFAVPISSNGEPIEKIVKCYDRDSNEIIEANCISYENTMTIKVKNIFFIIGNITGIILNFIFSGLFLELKQKITGEEK